MTQPQRSEHKGKHPETPIDLLSLKKELLQVEPSFLGMTKNGKMTLKGTRRSRLRDPTVPTNDARGAQPFPGRLMERDAPVMPSKEDIAMDTAAWDAPYVATMIATTSLKKGECAGDTEQILKNAVRKGAYSMRQKERCVGTIPDRNAVRKDANTMP